MMTRKSQPTGLRPASKCSGPAWRQPALRQAAWALKATAAAMAALLATHPAHGQSMEERLRTQLRATTQQLQQLQSEQAQTNAARAAAEAQRDAAQKELEQLRAQLGKAQGQAEQLAQQQDAVLASANSQIAAAHTQLGKFKDAYDELLAMARAREAERVQLGASLKERDEQLQTCMAKNEELYAAGKEVLAAYESFSTADLIALRQPFSQKARVMFDEKAQAYGDKLYDGKYDPRMTPQTGSQAAQQ
ncbi:DNA repair protein [Orrella sp. JC864]|uniref:DNA repair protein n=1 Tax=Orrella sp. JC864 TaxID=3120298 RepID=UPI0030088301